MLVGFDLETVPNMSDEILTQYENEKISKIMSHKTLKDATKIKKVDVFKEKMMLFRSGIIEGNEDILKDLSVDPLRNKICGVGLSWRTADGRLIKESIAGKNESELIDWFLDNISGLGSDVVFTGHYLQFDVNTMRLAIIRNDKIKDVHNKYLSNKPLFPFKKYSPSYIDTYDMYNTKLDNLAYTVLGENKVNNGSEVYKMYVNNEFDKIREYVKDDAQKSFRIAEILTQI